ncbi:MAG TPA: DUF4340 domain-containing protein [Verrucomicrobiae bacterium]|nr:DUF4340 domain-containing protein [Verrucomicrobiae bacterium]
MKLKGLLIACLVLAALLGALYWSNHHPADAGSSTKASTDVAPRILSLATPDITGLTIQDKGQPAVTLTRDNSGQWQITAPQPLAADQDAVSSLLAALSPLNAERLLEDKVSNPASYGLSAPAVQIDVALKNNKAKKVLIGDQTPSGNAFYAMLEGDPRLFTVATYTKSSLDKSSEALRDKRLITADFDKVTQLELTTDRAGAKEDITLARNKDSWQIVKPGSFRVATDQVDDLIRSLKDAKMETGSSSKDSANAAAFKSATLVAQAKILGASGTQELEIRKAKEQYYAKSSTLPGVYDVSATVATGLNKSLDDLRNKKLFDFGFEDPNKIEIHDGSKSYFFTRSGSDWYGSDGKKLDGVSFASLLGDIRDLAATRFPNSGFTTPAIEIVVTPKDGKNVERVSIAKSGEDYIAKRDHEPALYELSSASLQELQRSAGNIKSAAIASK